MTSEIKTIAIIGLGYVGLPLAVEFGKRRPVIGFDINQSRIDALRAGRDSTLEVSEVELVEASHLSFTADPADLAEASVYIVTVPTRHLAQDRRCHEQGGPVRVYMIIRDGTPNKRVLQQISRTGD